jgi:iron complex outermembrane receptor protein
MSRSRKRKLLSNYLRLKLKRGPKSSMVPGGIRSVVFKISANRLLVGSIATLLGTPTIAQTVASSADSSMRLDEIIVTATKRAQSIQDVPVSILALDSTMLDEHQVASLDDYTKLMPGVSIDSFGPGQADISFRGITTRTGAPTSGLYIDDNPVAASGANPAGGVSAPDLHLYDINRVEALSGPQGTLYGASSLSGTLKIVTNQPDTTKFAAGYDLQGDKFGSGGGAGGIVESFVNIPLSDAMALRLVGYYERDGGFIDNTAANRTYLRPHTLADGSVENAPLTINNAAYAKNNFNNSEIVGGRAALKVDLTSDWTLTPSLIAQQTRTDGEWLYDPKAGDLQVHDFTPNDRHDTWYLGSLAVQGKISDWDVTYTAAYEDRVIDQVADYSYFSVAYDSYVDYNYLKDALGHDIAPTQFYHTHVHDQQTAHEFRVASPVADRARVTAGLFYQRIWTYVADDYEVAGLANAVNPFSPPVPGANSNDVFADFSHSPQENAAVFTEVQFDLLKNLTLIGGVRGFHASNSSVGFAGQAGTIMADCPGAQTEQQCLNNNTHYKQNGETHKAGLSWKIDPQRLLYFTYSTGFRPGGGNPGYEALGQTIAPTQYVADTLTNFEIGWKTSWFDHRLIANGDIFLERWKNIQYALPGIYGLSAIDNVGDATSKGIEGNFSWRASNHLILSGGATYLDAYLTTNFCNVVYGCNPANGGELYAPKGTPLPVQPRLKFNTTLRYETKLAGGDAFVQGGANHQSSSTSYVTTIGEQVLGPNAGFTTADFSLGLSRGTLTYEAFIQNAFDERGVLSKNTVCVVAVCGAYAREYVTKPQFFGVKIGQRF